MAGLLALLFGIGLASTSAASMFYFYEGGTFFKLFSGIALFLGDRGVPLVIAFPLNWAIWGGVGVGAGMVLGGKIDKHRRRSAQ